LVTADQLAQDAQEFLRFKRGMGIPYRRAEFVLDQSCASFGSSGMILARCGSTTR
jgi:hypothetical protein